MSDLDIFLSKEIIFNSSIRCHILYIESLGNVSEDRAYTASHKPHPTDGCHILHEITDEYEYVAHNKHYKPYRKRRRVVEVKSFCDKAEDRSAEYDQNHNGNENDSHADRMPGTVFFNPQWKPLQYRPYRECTSDKDAEELESPIQNLTLP
jgi:hypothetical protein